MKQCDECREPIAADQHYFDWLTPMGRRRLEHATCRKAREEGQAVGRALVERDAARAEVARLRAALEAVCMADCCGCSVYERIARAALDAPT